MAGKLDKYEYDLLRLHFHGVAITNVAATAGTTSWWVGLCSADPTDAGSTANEGGYNAYTRVKTDRSSVASTGWAVSSGTGAVNATASPIATLSFPQATGDTTGTFTHFVVYPTSNAQASSGTYAGTLSPNIYWGSGVTPQITTGSSITED